MRIVTETHSNVKAVFFKRLLLVEALNSISVSFIVYESRLNDTSVFVRQHISSLEPTVSGACEIAVFAIRVLNLGGSITRVDILSAYIHTYS
jgi:hypothetical protein